MAIVFTHRLAGSDSNTGVQSAFTTASITPATDGSPFALWVATTRATGNTPPGPSSAAGMGLTWSLINGGTTRDAGGTALKLCLMKGIGTASTGTVVITLSSTAATAVLWGFVQMAGADPTNPFVTANLIQSTSTSNATSMSLTLPSSPAVGNAVLAAIAHLFPEDITAGTNFTKGTNITVSTPNTALNWEAKTVLSTTVDASWATNCGYNGLGYEIAAASTADTQYVGTIPF